MRHILGLKIEGKKLGEGKDTHTDREMNESDLKNNYFWEIRSGNPSLVVKRECDTKTARKSYRETRDRQREREREIISSFRNTAMA